MSTLVAAIGFGIAAGAVIALGALGFTLQFGLSNVLNIAYGAFVTVAAFLGWYLIAADMNPWLALVLVAIASALLSLAYYLSLIKGLVKRGVALGGMVISTVAAAIFVEYGVLAVAGPSVESYNVPSGATIHLGPITLPGLQGIVIVVAAALMVALHLILTRTTLGRAMRATAVNRTLARASGIATERVTQTAWLISGALGGVAGFSLALTTSAFDYTLGSTFLIVMVAAAVVGGVGQPYGAMLGGLIIGIATQVSAAFWDPVYANVIAFVLLVAVLLIRPSGVLGLQARRQDVSW